MRPGGVLFYAVPDKRYTFDHRRPLTQLEHMAEDHELGAERSKRRHYLDWSRLVVDEDEPDAAHRGRGRAVAKARKLEGADYSIHMHVWTQSEFLALILDCRERFGEAFDIEAAARQGIEFVVVLRKAGTPSAALAPADTSRWRQLARRGVSKLRNAISHRARRQA